MKALRSLRRGLHRAVRRWQRTLLVPGARVVFHPRYSVALEGVLDGQRGERILNYLIAEAALRADEVLVPQSLSLQDALLVHTPEYLESLDQPETLARMFPLVQSRAQPRDLLSAAMWACGGTVLASQWALRHTFITTPIFNLGGGFHHAHKDSGSGFCALADIPIAIAVLRKAGFTGRVLIIDLDLHQGDGNRELFADDPDVFTYSIHVEALSRKPAVMNLDVELSPGTSSFTYLRALRETFEEALQRSRPDLVFYLAGADIAASDAIGTFRVSDDALARRDRTILDAVSKIPTVVCLAGGYGSEAWRHPARTVVWQLTGEDRAIASTEEVKLAAFRTIRDELSPRTLRESDDAPGDNYGISERDLFGDLVAKTPSPGFLGYYSSFGLEVASERYGLLAKLRERGYARPYVDPEPETLGRHSLRYYADEQKRELLVELVLETVVVDDYRLLSIEWLLLQDPRRKAERPLLPGQKFPGLGCLDIVVGMLVMAAERLELDGLSAIPSHFHVAQKARRLFRFQSPMDEARFLALSQATSSLLPVEAAMAALSGQVIDTSTQEVVKYVPARVVLPVSERMKQSLGAPEFSAAVETAARGLHFRLRG